MNIKRCSVVIVLGFILLSTLVTAGQEALVNAVPVEFIGAVDALNPGQLIVDQLPVSIANTTIPQPVRVGSFVRVQGVLQADGSILATQVTLWHPEPQPVAQQSAPDVRQPPTPVLAETPVSDTSCVPGPDYWKTRPAEWPATVLTVGRQIYTQAELLNILYAEPGTDASLLLARQLVAAQLNILAGADASLVNGTLAQANVLLQNVGTFTGKLPYSVSPTTNIGQQMVNAANLLELFNTSQTAAECLTAATPDLTTSVVMEGTIDTVSANSLSVNGLEFQLDPTNPVLAAVREGDRVRIEGSFQDDGTKPVLIPANIQIARNVPPPPPVVNASNNTAPAGASAPSNPPPGGNNGGGRGMGDDDDDDDDDNGGMGMGDDDDDDDDDDKGKNKGMGDD